MEREEEERCGELSSQPFQPRLGKPWQYVSSVLLGRTANHLLQLHELQFRNCLLLRLVLFFLDGIIVVIG